MTARAYYNEFEPYAAEWLKNLIKAGLIADGDVDTRSITDVRPDDLKGYTQCHFFAGIGGWSYALRLAGWPDERPVWTGSCPCQPFSAAGKQKAQADERHLWPTWFDLIREAQPSVVFGEQVSAAIAHGWLDGVADDMEAEGYALGAAVLPACGVGAPHKRDRLWFVADAYGQGKSGFPQHGQMAGERSGSDVADTPQRGRRQGGSLAGGSREGTRATGKRSGLADSDGLCSLGNSHHQGSQGHGRSVAKHDAQGRQEPSGLSTAAGFWSGNWINCADGKQRLVKSGVRLLAHGVPGRVGKLRAYGNAIVPQVAAEFISAYLDCCDFPKAVGE